MIELGKFHDLDISVNRKNGVSITYNRRVCIWSFRPYTSPGSVDYLQHLQQLVAIKQYTSSYNLYVPVDGFIWFFNPQKASINPIGSLKYIDSKYHSYNGSEFCNFILSNSEVKEVLLLGDILE